MDKNSYLAGIGICSLHKLDVQESIGDNDTFYGITFGQEMQHQL